nr:uncharacterized mitochondrial protein AtMg00810-like [Tanacetum cinerariifolium]
MAFFSHKTSMLAIFSKSMDTQILDQPILPWTRRILGGKDGPGKDVELYLYRSIIGSLMYLTASRPDIMFAVCACARHQVTPKECNLHAIKRIFRYLKDSDYGGATQDRKSTTGGCQFLGRRLISWQCKKQTIMATSTIKAEYVAAASGCGQVLWIQNQMLDYRCAYISLRDDSQGEAFPTVTSLNAGQDKENIIKTSALPHDSTPRVTSLDADEGNLEITGLKARIKLLEDKDRGNAEPSGDDAPIKWRSMEIGEEVGVERSTELRSNDTKEMVNVLSSMEATNILTSGVVAVSVPPVTEVSTVSVPLVAGVSTVGVPTVSGLFPTVSAIFTTASVVTPYSRRPRWILAKDKGKEKVVESKEPKKKKLQEQIDAQVAREMEEEITREDQRMNEQLARDAEIARIHAEEELKMLIDGLDRSNEVIAKHLQEYEQSKAELTIRENIELINDLVKYQDHHAKILKYQAQQSKPLSKKEQREFYMSVLRSPTGWKTKHFRGMTLEEIKKKFIPVWKKIKDFMPMSSKEEVERVKRKGLRLEQGSAKRMKTSEDVSEEDLKGMMQLVHVDEVYVEALQVKHPIIGWEIHWARKITRKSSG